MKDLPGKVAVAAGGASGIGRALVGRFGHEGMEGMKVLPADVRAEPLDEATRALACEGIEVIGAVHVSSEPKLFIMHFGGATTTGRRELAQRYQIGVSNMLWGNDFSHHGERGHTRANGCDTRSGISPSRKPGRSWALRRPRCTTSAWARWLCCPSASAQPLRIWAKTTR
jgi:NAD(P)-dependent dehydrogenase (short-subunit alcohol dehydrogenase family)